MNTPIFSRRVVEAAGFCVLTLVTISSGLFLFEDTGFLEAPVYEEACSLTRLDESALVRSGSAHDILILTAPVETPVVAAAEPGVQPPPSRGERSGAVVQGAASWYGGADGLDGQPTASGEIFNAADFTAAHRTYSFGTRVRVTYLRTGRSVIVRINDRGPFAADRIIDLSRAAAAEIGLLPHGVGLVELEPLE